MAWTEKEHYYIEKYILFPWKIYCATGVCLSHFTTSFRKFFSALGHTDLKPTGPASNSPIFKNQHQEHSILSASPQTEISVPLNSTRSAFDAGRTQVALSII